MRNNLVKMPEKTLVSAKGEWNLSELVSDKADLDAKSARLESLTRKVEESRKFLNNDIG